VNSEVIVLDDWRTSFVQLETPKEIEAGKDPRFGTTFMADLKNEKNKPGVKALLLQARKIAQEAFGVDSFAVRQKEFELGLTKKAPTGKDDVKFNCFFDGAERKAKRPEWENYWILTAHNTVKDYVKTAANKSLSPAALAAAIARLEAQYRPAIANRQGVIIEPGDPQYPYSGCFVRGKVNLWTSEHEKGGRQIICSIRSMQFLRPGPAFGRAAIDPDKEFEKLEDDPEAEEAFDETAASENWDLD